MAVNVCNRVADYFSKQHEIASTNAVGLSLIETGSDLGGTIAPVANGPIWTNAKSAPIGSIAALCSALSRRRDATLVALANAVRTFGETSRFRAAALVPAISTCAVSQARSRRLRLPSELRR